MKCRKCYAEFREDPELYTVAGPHIRLDCPACGGFIKFIAKELEGEPADLIVPFGKYNGQTLGQILISDRSYLEFIARGTGNIGRAARKLLA